jgi:hypothetical protein
VGGNDELSATFLETKGHFYMHVGSLLLKMGQQSDIQWRALSELAALCYLVAFQVSFSGFRCSYYFKKTVVFLIVNVIMYNKNM